MRISALAGPFKQASRNLTMVQSQLEAAWSMEPGAACALLRDLEGKLASVSPSASEHLSRSREACLLAARLEIPLPLRERVETAGTLRMAFKKSLISGLPEAGNQALAVGVSAWLKQARRLAGWRRLDLLALTLRTLRKEPENDTAPQT